MFIAEQYEVTVLYDIDGVKERITDPYKITDKAGNQLDMSSMSVNDRVWCIYSPNGKPYSCRVLSVRPITREQSKLADCNNLDQLL